MGGTRAQKFQPDLWLTLLENSETKQGHTVLHATPKYTDNFERNILIGEKMRLKPWIYLCHRALPGSTQ